MLRTHRFTLQLFLGLLLAALALALPTSAMASHTQVAIFQEDNGMTVNPAGTLQELRSLGVGVIRVTVHWSNVAPAPYGKTPPAGFQATNPASPGYNWDGFDTIVRDAAADGIAVDFSVTGGAPIWATGGGKPAGGSYTQWRPSGSLFGQFAQAIGSRYSGKFTPAGASSPLPAVHMWEIWNEPNFGPDLAPQANRNSTLPSSAPLYRSLVDGGWSGLTKSGHAHDTIVLGNLDARGQSGRPSHRAPQGYPGVLGATKPVIFIEQLYCVDSRLRPLRGSAARADGCPTSGSRASFRSAHPGLFDAPGFGDHPYPFATAPNKADTTDANQAEFVQLPHFASVLDRIQHAWGSNHHFSLYNTEYGFITNPPNRSQHFASPALAAEYINWAEYLSFVDPRIASTMQFLLVDPNPRFAPEYGGFASGLEFYGGKHKPSYDAYRLPIFLPSTSTRRGHTLLIWGCARPAHANRNPHVVVQFQAHGRGAFTTAAAVRVTNSRGYFETRIKPSTSGSIRLQWTYPGGSAVYSRTVSVNVR